MRSFTRVEGCNWCIRFDEANPSVFLLVNVNRRTRSAPLGRTLVKQFGQLQLHVIKISGHSGGSGSPSQFFFVSFDVSRNAG